MAFSNFEDGGGPGSIEETLEADRRETASPEARVVRLPGGAGGRVRDLGAPPARG
jgi:hypothetical protein